MKISGAALAATGASLALLDAFRLANGDVSVLAGSSFAAAFATHATLFTGGLGVMQEGRSQQARAPTLILVKE